MAKRLFYELINANSKIKISNTNDTKLTIFSMQLSKYMNVVIFILHQIIYLKHDIQKILKTIFRSHNYITKQYFKNHIHFNSDNKTTNKKDNNISITINQLKELKNNAKQMHTNKYFILNLQSNFFLQKYYKNKVWF